MPQQPVNKEYSSFVKGIITEASPLTFPENASIDEENFILNRDGSRQRRLGMDYEEDYFLRDTGLNRADYSTLGVSTHLWLNVNEDPTLSFFIVQFGNKLWFFDALKESTSDNTINQSFSAEIPGNAAIRWQSASLGGRIIFCTGNPEAYSLTYDDSTDTVDFITHGLLTRDVWGVDDGLQTDERPVTLSNPHRYNLINQGWGAQNPGQIGVTYYDQFKTGGDLNKFPSNADLVQSGKNTATEDLNVFSPQIVERAFLGSTPSPKGHHIIDIFNRGETRAYAEDSIESLLNNFGVDGGLWRIPGIGVIPTWGAYWTLSGQPGFPPIPSIGVVVDKTDSGVRVIASYAERFFYGGSKSTLTGGDSKSPLLGHMIFYSQLVDAADKVGKCYQEADPTSEDQSDLVATDGGFIKIPGMSRCLKLVPYSTSLIVFAENGVWEITGGEGKGFKATDFSVTKLTDTGALNASSIVEVEDRIYYWSQGGIYALFRDQVSLGVQSTNISETTIQTFFESFSSAATENVTGTYDPVTKQVRWMLNTQGLPLYDGATERYRYNFEVIYDVILEAFYKSRLPDTGTSDPYVAGYLTTPGFLSSSVGDNVVIGVDNVVVGVDNVEVSSDVRVGDFFKTKYLTVDPNPSQLIGTYKFTFSFYKDSNFEDWGTHFAGTGIDAAGFLLTGQETLQDTQRQKQVSYLTGHFLRTETGFELNESGDLEAINPSSCIVQSQWDFTNSAVSGKFGSEFQAYRLKRNYLPSGLADSFDYGWEVVTSKNKLRGRGRALSLLFKTEPRKDLVILGWGLLFGVNSNV